MNVPLINYLQLMRAPAVFTAFSNILAAHLIVTQGNIQWNSLLLLLLASSFLYLAGMVLNDCFDYEEDMRDRPSRPLPAAKIAIKNAWVLGWSLLLLGVIMAGLVGLQQLFIALLLAVFIVVYNSFAKQSKIGIIVMGSCRYLNWLLGLSVVPLFQQSYLLALPIFIYVCSLTLLSTIETTAEKPKYLIFTALGVLLCAGVILYIHLVVMPAQFIFIAMLLILLLFIGRRLYKTYSDFSPQQIQQTIKFLVMGIIPLDAVITLSNTTIWNAIIILVLLLPGWFLARFMRVT